MGKNVQEEIKQIVSDAQEEFDLDAAVRGRSIRTKKVKVFTDEVTGEELGGAEVYEVIENGMPVKKIRTWGLTGKILDLSGTPEEEKRNAKEIKGLKAEVKAAADKLDESALIFELQAVPRIIKKDARRAARKALNINGKLTPDDPRWEDYTDEHAAQTLTRVVVSITQNSTGKVNKGLPIERARTLRNQLPETEFFKLDQAINELLWQAAIAEKAVEDSDF